MSTRNSNSAGPSPAPDITLTTKSDVEHIVAEHLMRFHDTLVDRGQIIPLSPNRNYGPEVEDT